MSKKWTRWISLFLLALFCSITFAKANLAELNGASNASTFDVQHANRILDKLSIQLSIVDVNPQNLERASSILSRLQKDAQECVNQSQSDIAKLDDQIEETKPGAQTNTPFIQYVQSKKMELYAQKSECKLFVLRSGEALTAFQTTVKNLSAKRLLTVKPDFWSNLITGITEIKQIPKNFNAQLFLEYGGWKTIHTPLALGLLGIFLLAGLVVGIQLNFSLDNYLSQLKIIETFSEKINLAILSTCKRYVTPIIILAILTADITVLSDPSHLESYLLTIVSGTFVYAVLSALIYFFFLPFHGLPPVSGLSESVAHPLLTRLRFLLALCLFGFIFYILFHDQPFPDSFMSLVHTTFITLLIINLISILWLINRIPKILNHHPSVRIIISSLLTVALITLVAAEWFGYQQLV